MGFLSGLLGTNQNEQNLQQQQALAQQLQAQSMGQGPNPAQQMLQQATQQNNAQNAGFLASQKGINPAIANRLASQNAANMSQMAAGQGALMGAEQQLAAEKNLTGLYGQMGEQNTAQSKMNAGIAGGLLNGVGKATGLFANGGMVQDSGIGSFLESHVNGGAYAEGGNVGSKLMSGGHVPGTPKVSGNSYSNDTVKALLSPGEVVIPNSIMQSSDPSGNAAKFVMAVMAKKRARR